MHPNSSSRKKIGIITGSGPEAGIDLWNKVLQANRRLHGDRFRGDLDAPCMTIVSEPTLGLSMELDANEAVVWACLRGAAEKMSQCVDYYAIACNTLNHYQPQLDALNLPARLVSFADAARDFLQASRIGRVALLGARPVTDLGPWSHYRALSGYVDIELPKPAQAAELHQLIYDVKTHGAQLPSIVQRLRNILDSLESDTVLLACTELPLIPHAQTSKHLVDVTDLVAQKLAQLSIEQ
ncbi:MAG TPA: aspartate/glutamate racemase family protein [Noviherbaspirillum sp.]